MTGAVPENAHERYMRQVKTVLVREEGEPLIEQALNAMAHRLSRPVESGGKP